VSAPTLSGAAVHPATEQAGLALGRVLASLEALQFRFWGDEGLTVSQLRVLFKLRDAGRASAGEIADHLAITPSTATALIERLVQRGLLVRGARAGDRRVSELRLSEPGQELIEAAAQRRRHDLRLSVAAMPVDERRRLARLLEALAEQLETREAARAIEVGS
jgi:DNA-binding MarR family transcriptional regulator